MYKRQLFGEGYIEDQLCGLTFRLSPASFYQVNHHQAQVLYEKAIAMADLHGTETVLDLYCGTGTITLAMAGAIISASALSFLGFGIQAPLPEWGAMLSAGRSFFRDHWFVETFPGLAIMLAVFAFNLFGDGLRDALDPRLKT